MIVEIKGLIKPRSEEAQRVCRDDINEIVAEVVQDKRSMERAIFDPETLAEEITLVRVGSYCKKTLPGTG